MIPRILIENIHSNKPIRKFGEGTATRTWIYISDIVSAFLCALTKPRPHIEDANGNGNGNANANASNSYFSEYNTGAPNSTTLNEMIAIAEKVVGKKAIIDQHPVPPGDAHTVGVPSYGLIEEKLGWKPEIGLEEGMRLTYLHYLEQQELMKQKS